MGEAGQTYCAETATKKLKATTVSNILAHTISVLLETHKLGSIKAADKFHRGKGYYWIDKKL